MHQIVKNLATVKQQVSSAMDEMHLPKLRINPAITAVSKTHEAQNIIPLLEANHCEYGENRVQEAQSKWPQLKAKYSNVKLHLIGALQTNKVKDAIALFDAIETIDRKKLADAIAKELAITPRNIECFIQINTGEEPQKSGIIPQEADDFIAYCVNQLQLPIVGLMCIPPANIDPAMHFALLKKIAHRNNLHKLSMGMSGDFQLATIMGATNLRVGSAIFGGRQ